MKKYFNKIMIGVLTCVLFLSLMAVNSFAAGSFSISKSSATITEGSTTTFNINTTNCEGKFTITSSNNSVVKVSSSEVWVTSSSSITLTAVKAGTAKITITAANVGDNSKEPQDVTGSKTITVTVKAKSSSSSSTSSGSGSSSGSSGSSTTTTTPKFTSVNKKVYTTGSVNLRSSWSTSSSATQVAKGTELTLTGTSTEKVDGYTWYRVTYNGSTKYIASSLVTSTKPTEEKPDEKDSEKSSNKSLSSLSIEGINITPTFDKETTQYTATVDGDVTELKIDTKAEDSKAKVEVEGNEGLKEGDNIIKVKVTAEDATTRTYFITVTKGEGIVTDDSLKLADLQIARVNFEGQFNQDTHTYELNLSKYVKNLDITATPNQADATVEITGNEEFKEGKNIVTILLTSADGSETVTYQIEVNLPAEVVANANEQPNSLIYIICGVVAALAIIILIIAIVRYRKNRNEDDTIDDEKDFIGKQYEKEEKDNEELENEKKTVSKRKKSDVSVDDFLDSQEEEKPKKPRGKHSV